jgi:uncharacterized protein (TIGR02444 family)
MSESALWRFALAFYRRPGVDDACLQLQDETGADVNVLLYLLFLAAQGRGVRAEDVSRIVEHVAVWRDAVVVPLRELRRKLNQPLGAFTVAVTAEFRNEVKRTELAAERIQLEALERLIAPDASPPAAIDRLDVARSNLAAYGSRLDPRSTVPLQRILDAFAQFNADEARR